MMRFKLTQITAIVTIAISLAGILVSGWVFHIWLERFQNEEQQRFQTATAQEVSSDFDGTIETIATKIQAFAYGKELEVAMRTDNRSGMTRLLVEFNTNELPIQASMLFVSRGKQIEWSDAHDFFTLPDHDRILRQIAGLNDASLYEYLALSGPENQTRHFLVFSSPVLAGTTDGDMNGALRVVYDVSMTSDLIARLIDETKLDCISIHVTNAPVRFAKCADSNDLVETSTLTPGTYLASTVPLSRFPVLAPLKATIYRDVSSFNNHWETVNRSILLTLIILLIIAVAFSIISAQIIRNAVDRLVEYVSSDIGEDREPPDTLIEEFQGIAMAYTSAQQKLKEQTEKKNVAEAKAMDLVSALDASQSQKMEALGTLTASVAHDFNNLLAIIRGQAETSKLMPEASEQTQTLADAIIGTVDRASGIVSQLMRYARPVKKNETVFRLDETLSSLVKEVQEGDPHNVRIAFENPENLHPLILMDLDQFKSVFLNLWLNAVDAMPDGGEFTVTLKPPEPEQVSEPIQQNVPEFVCIKFTDTGKGIESELLSRIFDPFFTTKSLSGGSGLGLAIIYSFVNGAAGHIEVQSTLGQGTSFSVLLPVSKIKSETRAPGEVAAPLNKGISGRQIFILEDEKPLSEIMGRMIEVSGGQTKHVHSLKDAIGYLETVSSVSFDALVLDYQLADGTGLQFHKALVAKFGPVPTLVISGNLDYLDREFEEKVPFMMRFLPKPFSCEEFIHELHETVRMRKVH